MNKDTLKEYIDSNRGQFDKVENPKLDHLWGDIAMTSTKDKQTHYRWLALVIVLFFMMSAMWYSSYKTIQKLNQLEQFVMSSPLYKMEHAELIKMVSEKEQLIDQLGIQESEYTELFKELQELDNNKIIFQKDFELYGDSRELMQTLFKNYERKAKILELLLFENQKKSHNENNNRHEM